MRRPAGARQGAFTCGSPSRAGVLPLFHSREEDGIGVVVPALRILGLANMGMKADAGGMVNLSLCRCLRPAMGPIAILGRVG